MAIRHYLMLVLLSLGLLLPVALAQQSPGYMDADYYFVTGLGLSSERGFQTNFLWNYLAESQKLPVPSHTYWMPLTSILIFISHELFGSSFFASRILLIGIAASIPVLTAKLSYSLTQNTYQSLFAGLLAILSGFYLVFLTTTDAFGIYILLGGMFFLLVRKIEQNLHWVDSILFGILAGLFHLARADGLLWLVVGGGMLIYISLRQHKKADRLIYSLVLYLLAYLVIMAPWYIRNFLEFGSLFPPGGSKALWLTEYDELFRYPASNINFEHWVSSGLVAILQARFWALGQNLQTLLAVQGSIILLPLIILGAWVHRRYLAVQIAVIYWLLLFVLMTIALPFPGVRGSFFHSGSSVQILFWALVPVGLDTFIQWGEKKRGWIPTQADLFFKSGILFILAILTIFLAGRGLGFIGSEKWGEQTIQYQSINRALIGDERQTYVVMVNNPPGFHLATDLPAIVIPSGPVESLYLAASQFGADYLVLEPGMNWPEIYNGEKQTNWLRKITEINGVQIYLIERK